MLLVEGGSVSLVLKRFDWGLERVDLNFLGSRSQVREMALWYFQLQLSHLMRSCMVSRT